MNRKGDVAGVIPFVFLMIAASAMFLSTFNLSTALGQETASSIDDLRKVSKTSATTSRFFYDFSSRAVELSAHQAAHVIGKEGGGIRWTESKFERPDDSDYERSIGDIPVGLETLLSFTQEDRLNNPNRVAQIEYINRTEYILNESYIHTSKASANCNLEPEEFSLTMPRITSGLKNPHINGTVEIGNFITNTCRFESGDTNLRRDGTQFNASYNASFNRYYQLYNSTSYILDKVQQDLEEVNSETGSDRDICDDSDVGPSDLGRIVMKNDKIHDLEARYENEFDVEISSIELPAGIDFPVNLENSDNVRLVRGGLVESYEESDGYCWEDTSDRTKDQIESNDEYRCAGGYEDIRSEAAEGPPDDNELLCTDTETKVEYDPVQASIDLNAEGEPLLVSMELEDQKYNVPVGDGRVNLRMEIKGSNQYGRYRQIIGEPVALEPEGEESARINPDIGDISPYRSR